MAKLVELTVEFRAADDAVPLNGAIARHETEVISLKLRAAARNAMCPLVEGLRSEIQGMGRRS